LRREREWRGNGMGGTKGRLREAKERQAGQ